MKYFNRLLATLLSALLFSFSFVFSAHAVYLYSGNQLDLPKDKKINETAIIAAGSVTVDSEINGDLFCAGKDIVVNGDVKGDVLCAGQSVKINGRVEGNVRIAAQFIEINGQVGRNVTTASQDLIVSKFASIKGDIFFGVQSADLRGASGRDLLGAADQLTISGTLNRNAKVAASKITLVDPAKIGGDFEYYMESLGTASVNQKNVKGNILKHEVVRKELPQKEVKEVTFAAKLMGRLLWAISSLLLGLTLLYFLRSRVLERMQLIGERPFVSGLIGLAVLILTPIVTLLLLVSVIGAPLAFVLFLEYVLSLILASIYPTILIGDWAIKLATKKKSGGLGWSLLAGTVLVGLLFLVPVIGPLSAFVLLCLGLGSIFLSYLPAK